MKQPQNQPNGCALAESKNRTQVDNIIDAKNGTKKGRRVPIVIGKTPTLYKKPSSSIASSLIISLSQGGSKVISTLADSTP
jgi:hypothetical protein